VRRFFLARIKQAQEQDNPTIEEFDEGQLALDGNYGHSNPQEQCHLFRERRQQIIDFVQSLEASDGQRPCFHPRLGQINLEVLVTIIALHDTYHVRQITEWRRSYAGVQR
jgi:hypothetical protein